MVIFQLRIQDQGQTDPETWKHDVVDDCGIPEGHEIRDNKCRADHKRTRADRPSVPGNVCFLDPFTVPRVYRADIAPDVDDAERGQEDPHDQQTKIFHM